MSENFNEIRSGDFATSRRGGISARELELIREKTWEGASIQAIATMLGRPMTDVAAMAAGMPRKPRASYPPRPQVVFNHGWLPPETEMVRITRETAAKYGVSAAQIRGPRRDKAVIAPRFEAMWRIYDTGLYSTVSIGRYFGGRDHATVMHAIRRHAEIRAQASGADA